jgi:large subunit ribosomal protein L15
MSKTLSTLVRMTKRAYRRVGRGQSSTRGKTSGRGGKGQTARAGNKRRPELRDMIKKLPKRRGYGKNRARTVNPTRTIFPSTTRSTRSSFPSRRRSHSRSTRREKRHPDLLRPPMHAKILGDGALTKKLSLKGIKVSASAKVAIEKAGGTITEVASFAKVLSTSAKAAKLLTLNNMWEAFVT